MVDADGKAVTGKVATFVCGEIGLDETVVVAIDGAHLAGPGIEDHKIAVGGALQHRSFRVNQGRANAEERPRRRTGLEVGGAGQGRDENAAGLGLPPGIDNRAAAVADNAIVPFPGFRIDRLTNGTKQPEA